MASAAATALVSGKHQLAGVAGWFVAVRRDGLRRRRCTIPSSTDSARMVSESEVGRQSSSRVTTELPDPLSSACSLCSSLYLCRCPSHPPRPLQAWEQCPMELPTPRFVPSRLLHDPSSLSLLEQMEARGEIVQVILTELAEEKLEPVTSALTPSVGARRLSADGRTAGWRVRENSRGRLAGCASAGWVGAHGHCARRADSNVPNADVTWQNYWRSSPWASEAVEASSTALSLPSRVEM